MARLAKVQPRDERKDRGDVNGEREGEGDSRNPRLRCQELFS